ncbi:DMT family transporter [Micromonospora cathayae]|uniref:DMT family transporter n=1 Tax=Micromonospora cathayae TaxID=3028804 RepID=A0ABY7ZLH8_9ACTN|nr:DMT family transporter [Micromonospora sp. HUAS 3]WDZ83824.1 DMT family transporter [Micromonospora sp. HUAS 3]
MSRTVWRGSALVAVSAAGFGLMPVFARYAYSAGLTVSTLLFLRFAVAATLLFGYLAVRRRLPRRVTARQFGALLLLGAVLYALQSLFYFSAVEHISPALAVLLLYLYPAFVLLLSSALGRYRPPLAGVVAILLSLAGMALVLGRPSAAVNLVGVLYAVGAAGVYAVYIVVGDRTSAGLPPLTTSAFVASFAGTSFLVVGTGTGELRFGFPAHAWLPVLGVAVVSTVVAIGAFFAGMAVIGPTRASIMSMVEPVVSIGAAWVLLGEAMTPWQALGGAVVLAGAVWGVTGAVGGGTLAEPSEPATPADDPGAAAQGRPARTSA